jgi:hypothetical protein
MGRLRSHTFTTITLYNIYILNMQPQEEFLFLRVRICKNIRSKIILRVTYNFEDLIQLGCLYNLDSPYLMKKLDMHTEIRMGLHHHV